MGSKVVHLLEHGHDAVAAPNTGVNTITGEGLAEALTGADVVVDVSNITEVGGPEQFRLDEPIRTALTARHDPRTVIADPKAGYRGAEVGEHT